MVNLILVDAARQSARSFIRDLRASFDYYKRQGLSEDFLARIWFDEMTAWMKKEQAERERTERVELRAAALYAQAQSMPDVIEAVTGEDWAAMAAVASQTLHDEAEERDAVELYAEMQGA